MLQEVNGKFGTMLEKTLFRPTNVHVKASKSGKLTSAIIFVKVSGFIIFPAKRYPLHMHVIILV